MAKALPAKTIDQIRTRLRNLESVRDVALALDISKSMVSNINVEMLRHRINGHDPRKAKRRVTTTPIKYQRLRESRVCENCENEVWVWPCVACAAKAFQANREEDDAK